MNLSSIIAILVILLLVIPALRYIYKNGTCGSCPDKGACSGHCDHSSYKYSKFDNETDALSSSEKNELREEYMKKNKLIDDIIKKHRI